MNFDDISDGIKHGIDALSIVTLLGTLTDMLPSIAAGLTIVWTALRIYESASVQKWISKKPKE